MKHKIIRITTVPMSLKYLLKGQMSFMSKNGFDAIITLKKPTKDRQKTRKRAITVFENRLSMTNLYNR